MPQKPQPAFVGGYTPGCALGISPPGPVTSAAHPLVFGSWLPEEFETLKSASPNPSPLVPASHMSAAGVCSLGSELASSCGAPLDGMDASYGSACAMSHHAPAPSPAISALQHLLMGSNCSSLLQHQLASASGQQLFLVPSALPVFAPQLMHFFGGLPGIIAAHPALLSAWGIPNGTAMPYQNVAYPGATGFWLQGLYYPSYEHLVAYRRRTIAYNFHYFGIRPYFRPPSDLPRPRPPASAKPAGAPHAAATAAPVAGASTVASSSSTPIPGTRAAKTCDDSDSPCCSPGSTSTCSNGDSDDAVSDICHIEAEADLSCDILQMAGMSPRGSMPGASAEAAVKAGQAQRIDGGLARAHCLGPGDEFSFAVAGSAAAAMGDSASACTACHDERLAAPGGGCAAAVEALSPVLSPVRCNYASNSSGHANNCDPCEEVREEGRQVSGHGAAGGVCPQWLECQLCVLLDRVVGDAILDGEDAA